MPDRTRFGTKWKRSSTTPADLPDINYSISFQSLIDIHERPFVVIDPYLRVVAVNKAHQLVYGLEPGQVVD